ncbi:hypothetical protein COCOBI_08-0190 [Coccomyxa sp. Obi]|nr:hypothetical protein COCOBI_08-0190 [Coccomyxa sp. Obi]
MVQPGHNAGQRSPPAFPHLPEEIWLRISSMLSTREWAGASGTCRALQQMQLEGIDIVTSCTELDYSALKWLMRRMGSARRT